MTRVWKVPMRAHVCTTANAPNIKRADVYLTFADRYLSDAELLNQKAESLRSSAYRFALINGACQLQNKADRYVQAIQERGALLHYGVSHAQQLAKQSWATRTEGLTC